MITKEVNSYLCHGRRKVVECSWGHKFWDRDIVMIDLITSRYSIHRLLLCFILLHISNSSVSVLLVGHILYSADLTSTICIPYYYLMVYRYIYSRYSPIFPMLYQLYYSLPFSTLISSLSLYLSVTTWVTPQDRNTY